MSVRLPRDIGPIRDVVNSTRRSRCKLDLRRFLETYFPSLQRNNISQLVALEAHQKVILTGGRDERGHSRGDGATTRSFIEMIWAMLYGHRKFCVYVSSSRSLAESAIYAIRSELETNLLLQEDFPEVCQPFEALEGKVQRCQTQASEGQLTQIELRRHGIVLPWFNWSDSRGARIEVRGINGSFIGMSHRQADGRHIRPDLVICDDVGGQETMQSVHRWERLQHKMHREIRNGLCLDPRTGLIITWS